MDGRLVVLRLDGDWDVYRIEELERLLLPVRDVPRLALDLSECRYLDCSFLGRLAQLRKHRAARGLAEIRLITDSPFQRRLFDLVGFGAAWPIYTTLGEARLAG